MYFQYYRIFFTENQTILGGIEKKTRAQHLQQVLNDFNGKEFTLGRSILAFSVERVWNNLLYVRLGKKLTQRIGAPATEHFKQNKLPDWQAASIFIDLDDNPQSGQTVACEVRRSIFREPLIQLKALADNLNPYLNEVGLSITINPEFDTKEFWQFCKEYEGKIQELHVRLTAPNLFGGKTEFENDLNTAKKYNYRFFDISLTEPEGNLVLPDNDAFLNDALEYSAKGGGSETYIRVKGKKFYAHKRTPKGKSVGDVDVELANASDDTIRDIISQLFSWLKD